MPATANDAPAPTRGPDRLWVLALIGLVAIGAWFRVTSLRFAPEPHADEYFFGVQALRLARGDSVELNTPSGNPLDLFLVGMQAPLVSAFDPSSAVLRAPAALCGMLAVALTWWLGRRSIGQPAAAIAAGLLACLPIAIIFSRIGWESSQTPLFGALALACAFSSRRIALLAVYLLGLIFVHPTTFLLAPMLWAIVMVKLWERHAGDRRRLRREWAITTLATGAIAAPIAWLKSGSQAAAWTYATYQFRPCDWGEFLSLLKKMLLGFCMGVSTETTRRHDVLFWTIVLAVAIPGLVGLVRRRQWDRLALVLGTIACTSALHLATGPDVLHPGLVRYGMFLVVPLAWSFASLAAAALVTPATPRLAAVRHAQLAGLTALGLTLLVGAKWNWFDAFAAQQNGKENLWTLRTESDEPRATLAAWLADDLRHTPPEGRHVAVLAEDWWNYRPTQFHLMGDERLKFTNLEAIGAGDRANVVADQLRKGAYVIAEAGHPIEAEILSAAPRSALWVRHHHADWRTFGLYRLRRPGTETIAARCKCETPAIAAGDADTSRR